MLRRLAISCVLWLCLALPALAAGTIPQGSNGPLSPVGYGSPTSSSPYFQITDSAGTVYASGYPAQNVSALPANGWGATVMGSGTVYVSCPNTANTSLSYTLTYSAPGDGAYRCDFAVSYVTPPLGLAGFTIAPNSIPEGSTATGTVTLNQQAGSNTLVSITYVSSSGPSQLSYASSVTIPTGSSSANFTITTTYNPSDTAPTNITLKAAYSGSEYTAALGVTPPASSGGGSGGGGSSSALGYAVVTAASGNPARAVGLLIQGSSDKSAWTLLGTVPSSVTNGPATISLSADPKPFRYLRVYDPGFTDQDHYCHIAEYALYSGSVAPSNALHGTAITSGAYNDTNYALAHAQDGDPATEFATALTKFGWVGIDQGGTTAPAAPGASIMVSPTSVVSGSPATLTWSTSGATSVTVTGQTQPAASGSVSVSPTGTTTYTITATNSAGTTTNTATLTVTPAPSGSGGSPCFGSSAGCGDGQSTYDPAQGLAGVSSPGDLKIGIPGIGSISFPSGWWTQLIAFALASVNMTGAFLQAAMNTAAGATIAAMASNFLALQGVVNAAQVAVSSTVTTVGTDIHQTIDTGTSKIIGTNTFLEKLVVTDMKTAMGDLLQSLFVPDPSVLNQFENEKTAFMDWGPYHFVQSFSDSLQAAPGDGKIAGVGLDIPVVSVNASPQPVVALGVQSGAVSYVQPYSWYSTGQTIPFNVQQVTSAPGWATLRLLFGGGVWLLWGASLVGYLMPKQVV